MKIKELIKNLQEIEKLKGDIEVKVCGAEFEEYSFCSCNFKKEDLTSIEVNKDNILLY